jgi:hypothetical protein
MKLDDQVYLLGIRHHGPGSAQALLRALDDIQPDLILLEGAEELQDGWPLMLQSDMMAPVAQLVFDPRDQRASTLYPWALFSPEWQAMRYAGQHKVALRMMDLPAGIAVSLDDEYRQQQQARQQWQEKDQDQDETDDDNGQDDNGLTAADSANPPVTDPETCVQTDTDIHRDYAALLQRRQYRGVNTLLSEAGEADPEAWWDLNIEHHDGGAGSFDAIARLMTEARSSLPPTRSDWSCVRDSDSFAMEVSDEIHFCAWEEYREQVREAWMRKHLRQARKDARCIVVVCGAWHVPALAASVKVKDDNALLKGLKKRTMEVAWIPYSYDRLTTDSGYGAGIEAPGWYEFLFQSLNRQTPPADMVMEWMVHLARCLREAGHPVSTAEVIDAVRLSLGLQELRGLRLPGLIEMQDAALATLCAGNRAVLDSVRHKVLVGDRIGQLSAQCPLLPLERDMEVQAKKLRLKRSTSAEAITLDLRQPIGIERSCFFHRLTVLGIHWAKYPRTSGQGTARESWHLQWSPDLAIHMLDASLYGSTIEAAASRKLSESAAASSEPEALVAMINQVLNGNLIEVMPVLVQRLGDVVAVSADVQSLMSSVLELAQIIRYGSVRALPVDALWPVLEVISIRVHNGLEASCIACDDDAARQLMTAMDAASSGFAMLHRDNFSQRWGDTLLQLAAAEAVHPLIQGRVCRLLLDSGELSESRLEEAFYLALSASQEVLQAAAWIEGLLSGGAPALLYDNRIFSLLDGWVCCLDDDHLLQVLPVLRRIFATFASADLSSIGDRVLQGKSDLIESSRTIDPQLAESALDCIARLLGLKPLAEQEKPHV